MPKVELSEAAKKARADYIKEWRRKNPDKTSQYNANHWEKVAAEQQTAENENDSPGDT